METFCSWIYPDRPVLPRVGRHCLMDICFARLGYGSLLCVASTLERLYPGPGLRASFREKATRASSMIGVQQNRVFTRWRNRAVNSMPSLAARVFALRDKFYIGCGFHWGLEKDFGVCLFRLNNYDDGEIYHGKNAWADQIALQVRVTGIHKQVAKAEATVRL